MYLLKGNEVYESGALFPPNFAFLGFLLILFSLFFAFFLCGFFKTGYMIGKPFLVFAVAAFLFITVIEIIYHVPGLQVIGVGIGDDLLPSLLILIFGIAEYVTVVFLSYRKTCRDFVKND